MDICFVSLGCDKNLVDAEHMLYLVQKNGYRLVEEPEAADVVVVNSCCFIADALQESIDTVIELGKLKETGHLKALILAGCMGQRYSREVFLELPEVDGIIGTNSYDALPQVIEAAMSKSKPVILKEFDTLPANDGRLRSTILPYSYLKIAEGCDKRCSYCIIPMIRGGYRSVPMEELVAEAKHLAASGVTEIGLVAQEVTLYGIDIYGKKMLPELLRQLSMIDDLKWIRLLYCYPEEITEELILEMQKNPKVCHYLDIPIQHCNNDILARMGRKTTKEDIIAIVNTLRLKIPDIAIRTTVICGFPGETDAAHQELLDFVDAMDFDRLGAFAYSKEDGTRAAAFTDQIDDDTKTRWVDEVMSLQQKKVFARNRSLIGEYMDCIVDGKVEDGVYACRSYRDAPDVDGIVFVESERDYISGTLIKAHITDEKEYDLLGVDMRG